MPTLRSTLTVLATALLLAMITGAAPASAAPPHCRSVKMSVSRHAVGAKGWVRVRGRTCRGRRHGRVKIKVRGTDGWRIAGRARVRASGRFTRRVRIHLSQARQVVHLRAVQSRAKSKTLTVRAASAPPPAAVSACASPLPTTPVGMTAPGCNLIFSDTSSNPNPVPIWGPLQCVNSSRYSYVASGGDPHPTETGAAQPDSAFRELTVDDGDDMWGERCELGLNDHRTGPTAFYHEGEHRITYLSERLPSSNYPLSKPNWQTVMQMKQAQPADGGGEGPMLEMNAREGKWIIFSNWKQLYSFPAQANQWTRFAWDVYYSQDPAKGWLQVSADLNGDNDFEDPGERSPVIHVATLKTEIDGPNGTSDGLAPGDPIPSHLRVGIYHDPAIPCPAPTGCSSQVDNVQVVG